jgi:hypothetical protein
LLFSVRGCKPIVGKLEGRADTYLVMAACNKTVVDVDVREARGLDLGPDDPADSPGDHSLFEGRRADRHRSLAQPWERSWLERFEPVIKNAFEARPPIEKPQIMPLDDV